MEVSIFVLSVLISFVNIVVCSLPNVELCKVRTEPKEDTDEQVWTFEGGTSFWLDSTKFCDSLLVQFKKNYKIVLSKSKVNTRSLRIPISSLGDPENNSSWIPFQVTIKRQQAGGFLKSDAYVIAVEANNHEMLLATELSTLFGTVTTIILTFTGDCHAITKCSSIHNERLDVIHSPVTLETVDVVPRRHLDPLLFYLLIGLILIFFVMMIGIAIIFKRLYQRSPSSSSTNVTEEQKSCNFDDFVTKSVESCREENIYYQVDGKMESPYLDMSSPSKTNHHQENPYSRASGS